MTVATITWAVSWEGVSFVDPAACKHPGPAALAVGLRFETHRRRRKAVVDAQFCMLCGTDSTGQMTPEAAREVTWKEHGWHESTRNRLLAFAGREAVA